MPTNVRRPTPAVPAVPAITASGSRATPAIRAIPAIPNRLPTIPNFPVLRPTGSPDAPSVGRPSVNLGHPLNSSAIKPPQQLNSDIRLTHPIPFRTVLPPIVRPPNASNWGQRVRSTVQAFQRPTHAAVGSGERPDITLGHRISNALRTLRETR